MGDIFFRGIFYNEPRNDLFYVFVCVSIALYPINDMVGIYDNEVNVIILKGFSLIIMGHYFMTYFL